MPITSKVSRELSQTMLAQRTQDVSDTVALVMITTTQRKESGPQKPHL